MADYANDVLVEPEWLEQHLNDDTIRIVEVDENPGLYEEAHIPGALFAHLDRDLSAEKTGRNGRHWGPSCRRYATKCMPCAPARTSMIPLL